MNRLVSTRAISWIAATILSLSGCAVFEALGGMPRKSDELAVRQNTSTSHVFACVEQAISSLNTNWDRRITKRDEPAGVIETGNYSKSNIAGFRVRATHVRSENILEIELKGAGPYYVDIGVDEGMQNLKAELKECL
ncbi:MAG TPA: hypothetical protein VIE65_18015 [Methylobacter sp.]|jgi:hypothetical protein